MKRQCFYSVLAIFIAVLLSFPLAQSEKSTLPIPIQALEDYPATAIAKTVLANEGAQIRWDKAVLHSSNITVPTTTGKVSLLYTFKGSQVTRTFLYYSEVEQLPICHYPPGNPSAAHTITVGASAVGTHIEKHGDTFGPCEGDPNAEPIRVGYSNLDTLFFKTHDLMPGGGLVQKEGSRANDNPQTLEDLFTPFVFDFYDDYKEKYPEFPAQPLPPIEDDTPPRPVRDSDEPS